ncbi:MAG: hypothetical protein ACXV5U_08095 [Ilumatobacteraceae bacterium]
MDQGARTAPEPAPPPSASAVLDSSALPPPPQPFAPAGDDADPWVGPVRLAGQLSPTWRLLFGLGWTAIIACNAAVWESSRVIGLSTWWLGAEAQPRLILLQLLPFYGPLLVAVAAISNWRYAPYLGIIVGLGGAAIGAGDLGRVRWIAVVELVLGGAAICISAASLAGMYRRPVAAAPSTSAQPS